MKGCPDRTSRNRPHFHAVLGSASAMTTNRIWVPFHPRQLTGGRMSASRRAGLTIATAVALLGVLLAVSLAVFLLLRDREGSDEPDAHDRHGKPGFREDAEGAGLTFQMAFLPEEQGE